MAVDTVKNPAHIKDTMKTETKKKPDYHHADKVILKDKNAPINAKAGYNMHVMLQEAGWYGVPWTKTPAGAFMGVSEGVEIGAFLLIYVLVYATLHGWRSLLPHGNRSEENPENKTIIIE